MTSNVEKLESAMKAARKGSDDKLIFGFIEEYIDQEGIPTIPAILYAIDRTVSPTIIWDRIPDLLDLFALAEEYRKQTVSMADEALTWDELYRREDADDIVDGDNISPDERAYLKKIRRPKNESTRRETYRTVVMNLCLMHIRQLRQSEVSYLIPLYFPQYFPAEDELLKIREEKSPLWLCDMSDSELFTYELMRKKAHDFLDGVEEWEERNYPNISDDTRVSSEYQNRFDKDFPPFFSLETIVNVLRHHVQKIDADINRLREIFPDN